MKCKKCKEQVLQVETAAKTKVIINFDSKFQNEKKFNQKMKPHKCEK